ncbi:unnamed protein product [Rotaria magnacalcarata]|uniref:Uncharacterized protein n=2 Tax=Rotaria magnacalcarata TaxID=392030 RepID=A0A8S2T887_9BILA|nr:unnamed protein product [Rotaria magnacalcarata]
MGSKCSTLQIGGKVHISGNGNSPLIINGITYNISSLFNTVVSMTMRQYRSELILVQFISAFVVLISVLLTVRFLISRFPVDKGFLPTQRKHEIQHNTDILEYQKHFEELYLAQPLECIQHIYNLFQASPHLVSLLISKMIDNNYASLCVSILKLNIGDPHQYSETWQYIKCMLNDLYCYTAVSATLCSAVVSAETIPVLISALSEKSYLEDSDRNTPVMLLFQLGSRMFHNIAQVEMLKHNLDKYNCCEILRNVISNTNNRLLRAINLLTVARILKDGTYKVAFTIDDSSMLFRLYYESIKSKEHAAHGLKQEHILNEFYAIGRLDCLYHDY